MKTIQPPFLKGKLTEGSISFHLIKLSVPMLLGMFTLMTFNIVDTFFITQLGTEQLAAISFTFPTVMIISSIAIGLGNGAELVIARVIGEGNLYKVQRTIADSLMLSLVIASILTFINLATIEPFFAALGAKAEIISLIREYIQIIYIGSIFGLVSITANNAVRASGNAVLPSLLMISATAINFVLDPLLIFGWGVFPRLELRGAAFATVIAQAITLISCLIILDRERKIAFNLPSLRELFQDWKNILHIAIPIIATKAIKPISAGLITRIIAVYGSAAIAGFGIISRVEMMGLIVFLALAASMGTIVGQNWGAGKLFRINRTFQLSLRFCLIWGVLVAIVLTTVSAKMASIFDQNAEVITIVVTYFAIVPISYAALGIIEISSSTFNAIEMPLPPVAITFIHTIILYLPLATVGSRFFGVKGIFLAICLSNLLIGIIGFAWNRRTLNFVTKKKLKTSPPVI
ncbi:MATE family efflux transporter [Myxosarcina sp. GI1(2024)]